MTTKKKAPAQPAKTNEVTKARARVEAAATDQLTESGQQLKVWEEAVRLFSERKFEEACERFRQAATGPASHIADKARSYLQICQRKTIKIEIDFHTAEDHFNYGVERLNARDMEQARFHFGRALGLSPDADHIRTMALCCGLAGDGNGVVNNLKRAIDLEPRNRILARQDPEFSALALQLPALRALLGADSSGPI